MIVLHVFAIMQKHSIRAAAFQGSNGCQVSYVSFFENYNSKINACRVSMQSVEGIGYMIKCITFHIDCELLTKTVWKIFQ